MNVGSARWRAVCRRLSVGALLLWVTSAAWAIADDLALYLDFEQIAPYDQDKWSEDTQLWTVPDQSTHGNYWFLSAMRPSDSHRYSFEGDLLETWDGPHGKALKIAASVQQGHPVGDESLPRDAISVLVWHRRIGNWLYEPLGVRDHRDVVALVAGSFGRGIPVWQMTHREFYFEVADFQLFGEPVGEGQWAHYAATYDPVVGIARLYTEGELVGEASSTAPLPEDWGFGDHWLADPTLFDAAWLSFDDLSIWRRALTAEEIRIVMDYGPLELPTAVSSLGKAATTWGHVKASRGDGSSR